VSSLKAVAHGTRDPGHPPPYQTNSKTNSRLSGHHRRSPRSLQAHSDHNEPDFSNSKGRARSCCLRNGSSSSNSHDLIHSQLLGIESFVSAPRNPRVVISRKQSHQKSPSTLSYSNSLRMPRRFGVYVLASTPHPVLGRSITPNSSIPITHKRHMAITSPIFHPHKPRRLGP
jgi:hypothetical protein